MKQIKSLKLKNCGAVPPLDISNMNNLNLIIGENGTGKTFVLKAMYTAIRSAENYKRGNDIRTFDDILIDRLRWTYQVEKINEIVNRNSESPLEFDMLVDDKTIQFSVTKKTTVKFRNIPAMNAREIQYLSLQKRSFL